MYCNTTPSAARLLCHNTLQCIVIQTSIIQPPSHNTLPCIAIQFPINPTAHVAIHNTLLQYHFQPSSLQYNFVLQLNLDYSCNTIQAIQAPHIAIQFPPTAHPKGLGHDTIASLQYKKKKKKKKFTIVWAVAQKRFLHQKKIFFFFHFSFPLIPATGKFQKIHVCIFFFFHFP